MAVKDTASGNENVQTTQNCSCDRTVLQKEPTLRFETLIGKEIVRKFPREIFLERTGGEMHYYCLDLVSVTPVKLDPDTQEPVNPTTTPTLPAQTAESFAQKQRFDELRIVCEDGCIDSVSIVVDRARGRRTGVSRAQGCAYSDQDAPVFVKTNGTHVSRSDEMQVTNRRSEEVGGKTLCICDITNEVVDLLDGYNDSNIIPKVPSIKKSKIKVTASNATQSFDWEFCEGLVYIVWKKLVSRTISGVANGHQGITDYLAMPTYYQNGSHLFYYRFTHPDLAGYDDTTGFDGRHIDIRVGQDYWDTAADREQKVAFTSIPQEVHINAKNAFDYVVGLAKRINVSIDYVEPIKTFRRVNNRTEVTKDYSGSKKTYSLDKFINTFDGAWNERVQSAPWRRYISMHSYGLAVDLNTNNPSNHMHANNWEPINTTVKGLKYVKCEVDHIMENKEKYFFDYTGDIKSQVFVRNMNTGLNEQVERWRTLENWFLYHLAFKRVAERYPNCNFYWGGYFGPSSATDAMHFSLVENPGNERMREHEGFFPPSLDNQFRIEYCDGSNKLLTVYFNPAHDHISTISWPSNKIKGRLHFSNWNTNVNGSGTRINAGNNVRILASSNNGIGTIEVEARVSTRVEWRIMSVRTLKLYAQWINV